MVKTKSPTKSKAIKEKDDLKDSPGLRALRKKGKVNSVKELIKKVEENDNHKKERKEIKLSPNKMKRKSKEDKMIVKSDKNKFQPNSTDKNDKIDHIDDNDGEGRSDDNEKVDEVVYLNGDELNDKKKKKLVEYFNENVHAKDNVAPINNDVNALKSELGERHKNAFELLLESGKKSTTLTPKLKRLKSSKQCNTESEKSLMEKWLGRRN